MHEVHAVYRNEIHHKLYYIYIIYTNCTIHAYEARQTGQIIKYCRLYNMYYTANMQLMKSKYAHTAVTLKPNA